MLGYTRILNESKSTTGSQLDFGFQKKSHYPKLIGLNISFSDHDAVRIALKRKLISLSVNNNWC